MLTQAAPSHGRLLITGLYRHYDSIFYHFYLFSSFYFYPSIGERTTGAWSIRFRIDVHRAGRSVGHVDNIQSRTNNTWQHEIHLKLITTKYSTCPGDRDDCVLIRVQPSSN